MRHQRTDGPSSMARSAAEQNDPLRRLTRAPPRASPPPWRLAPRAPTCRHPPGWPSPLRPLSGTAARRAPGAPPRPRPHPRCPAHWAPPGPLGCPADIRAASGFTRRNAHGRLCVAPVWWMILPILALVVAREVNLCTCSTPTQDSKLLASPRAHLQQAKKIFIKAF